MKKCQFCAEAIQDEAIKCRYCGSMLTPAAPFTPSTSSDAIAAEILQLARNGRKIQAIKRLRDHSTLDLKTAKEYVEGLEKGMPLPRIALAPRPAGNRTTVTPGGCLAVLAVGALIVLMALWMRNWNG